MFEELNNRRKAVEQNIAKSFVDETDLEKARQKKTFAIGDTFTRHGITYRCTGISPVTGRPTWSKVKDDSSKQEAAETGKQYKKFADDVQKEHEEQPKQKSLKQKLSDLEVGDEVTIVTDNKGKITKKNAKITKVNSASFEVDGERFFKRTGYHVGMDNVKIEI